MKAVTAFKKMELQIHVWSANHITLRTNRGIAFVSYNSIIGFKDFEGNVTLGKDWNYSRTTTKYLNQWLRTSGVEEIRTRLENGIYDYDENLDG